MDKISFGVAENESPRILVALEGSGKVKDSFGNEAMIKRGQTILVPAEAASVEITAISTPLKVISVFIE